MSYTSDSTCDASAWSRLVGTSVRKRTCGVRDGAASRQAILRGESNYFAETVTALPSYLTTWSGVAVTSRPAPWSAPTQTMLKVLLAGMSA